MRVIDPNELSNRMYHEAFEKDSDMQKWEQGCWIRYKVFENCLADTPVIDIEEPKHGEWIKRPHRVPLPWDYPPEWNDDSYNEKDHSIIEKWWHCNKCGYEASRSWKPIYNFCPNCGARMI